jgi:hypothetical protein
MQKWLNRYIAGTKGTRKSVAVEAKDTGAVCEKCPDGRCKRI